MTQLAPQHNNPLAATKAATKTKATSQAQTKLLFSYKKYWAERFGSAPFLPTSREEMDQLGWDSCDIIIITGDAYIDHPSFGMAILGRLLEAQGFRVGIIAQPDWQSTQDFMALGRPNIYFGVTAGNMDSMVNRYTSDRRIRQNDAYTPNNEGGKRPDRAIIPYSQRAREAYKDVPIIIGGIEASLRRVAHYDYWSEKVRRSVLLDSRADILLFGNAERAIVEISHRLAKGEMIAQMADIRGTAVNLPHRLHAGFMEINSTSIDNKLGKIEKHINPYLDNKDSKDSENNKNNEIPEIIAATTPVVAQAKNQAIDQVIEQTIDQVINQKHDQNINQNAALEVPDAANIALQKKQQKQAAYIRLPSYADVKDDPILYAHTSRLLHLETNPHNARPLVQQHGDRDIWINPAPIPLTTPEMDGVFDLPYARNPHPSYAGTKIPAWEMIRFSVNIMRGCFGGCTFCSITEHEGRIIQSRSEESVLKEIEEIRDKTEGFTGTISDLGGPTANMYRLSCKDPEIEKHCRKLSCVYPDICSNLNTDHSHLTKLYRKARDLKGVKRILIASGLRYDLAIKDPEYVKELVTYHVGGYLKIAPEHTQSEPLSKMMKPGIANYDKFKELFEKFSKEAGKEQYLIPYFIAAHPGTSDEDMLNLAIWLKANGFRADQVQAYLPTPMSVATAMYHSGKNPLKAVKRDSEDVIIPKGLKKRRLHKAFLRYHDAENWPLLRESLRAMGRADLIGNGKLHLIPDYQPRGTGLSGEGNRVERKYEGQSFLTKGIKPFSAPSSNLPPAKFPSRFNSKLAQATPIAETLAKKSPSKKGWAKSKKK